MLHIKTNDVYHLPNVNYKKENDNLKKGTIIALSIVAVLILTIVISAATILTHRNTIVSLEERVNAQYTANQSNYDNMWKKFKEMTQVTDIQAEQIKDVYTDLIAGRYDDPNVLFKMVQEQNPNLDTSVYTQLQREISAGRTQFDNNQKQIADIIREYNTYVRVHFITSAIIGAKELDAGLFVVTSEQTQKAFQENKADVIDLR